MAAVTATAFQASDARREIQLVVGHQDGVRLQLVKIGERSDRLAAAVHISGGNQQAEVHAGQLQAAGEAEELCLRRQGHPVPPGEFADEVRARVVPGATVGVARITQADNQGQSHGRTACR